jgi:L-threonylcarbamoyladenylate synthase
MELINNPTFNEIKKAAKALKEGHLVAFPTETVYGLGADATNKEAVSRIYSVKGRPPDHPLIVHISSINLLNEWATDIPEFAMMLARKFWPGPMTLILKRKSLAKDFITGGQSSVGIRIPSDPIAQSLLKEFEKSGGFGIAAPSANRFGEVSSTTASSIVENLGSYLTTQDLVLDGGQCKIGIESTIIDCTKMKSHILRPGAVTIKMIEKITDVEIENTNSLKIRVSGSFDSHYAPKARVILDQTPKPGDGLIALSNVLTPWGVIRLASPENEDEFARILYSSLQEGDNLKLAKVIVMQPTNNGISFAIRERLSRAAGIQHSIDLSGSR